MGVALAPAGAATPLTWIATVDADESLDVHATFDDGAKPVELDGTTGAGSFLVKGLRANTTYDASFRFTDASGRSAVVDADPFTTDPLPDEFPAIAVNASDPARMEPGFTTMLIRPWLTDGVPQSYYIALDDEGQVVSLLLPTGDALVDTRFSDDTLVSVMGNPAASGGPIEQYTLEGDLLQAWVGSASPYTDGILCGSPGFEHDVVENPFDGTWVALMKEERTAPSLPVSYQLPVETAPSQISVDSLFVFDPSTPDCTPGVVVPVGDLLDPDRIGYDSLDIEEGTANLHDWGHGNGIWPDPDGGYIVSLRNQDAVVKVRDGQLVWILGNHENWGAAWVPYLLDPTGPLEWQYHQHSPQLSPTDASLLLVMDNGDQRVTPFTGEEPAPESERYTRVVEYRVDEDAHTVAQTWELREIDGQVPYSPFVGDADYLPVTGHIFATFGYLADLGGVANADRGEGAHSIRSVEVSHDDPSDVVFDVELSSTPDLPGWTTYRAQHVASLYGAAESVH